MMIVVERKPKEQENVIKRILKFNDYKECLLKNKIILNHNTDLKVKRIIYILKNSKALHYVVMMIKDYKLLTELQRIHMEQILLKCLKVRC